MGCDSTLNLIRDDKKDTCSEQKFRIAGAFVTGRHHIAENKPCEDSYSYRYIGDALVISVADGVSSVDKGGIGSDIVTNSVLQALEGLMPGEDMEKIFLDSFQSARNALQERADSDGLLLSSYATTLILVYLYHGKAWCGHIGDGVVVCEKEGKITVLSESKKIGYANETDVLTTTDWRASFRFSSLEVDSVIISTDGCQNAIIRNQSGERVPHGPFILPMIRHIRKYFEMGEDSDLAIRNLLLSEKMQAITSDDMTLVVAIKPCGENC